MVKQAAELRTMLQKHATIGFTAIPFRCRCGRPALPASRSRSAATTGSRCIRSIRLAPASLSSPFASGWPCIVIYLKPPGSAARGENWGTFMLAASLVTTGGFADGGRTHHKYCTGGWRDGAEGFGPVRGGCCGLSVLPTARAALG